MSESSSNTSVRSPAVAGLFYPNDAVTLRATIDRLLATPTRTDIPAPKALIVPHAGYPYSGPVAAAAYNLVMQRRSKIRRVVLIGPSHRVFLRGIALPRARVFTTPLGAIPIDDFGYAALLHRGDVLVSDAPHELEHCLEVQLPFLQTVLDDFTLLPLVAGTATPDHVASVLETVWGGEETLILASSDLSHYLPYDAAQKLDAETAHEIVELNTIITHEQACGATAINGLLMQAHKLRLAVTEIARQNSGDTAGDKHRVVGYGAFAIHEPLTRRSQ